MIFLALVLASFVQEPKPEDLAAFMEKWKTYESFKVPMDPKDEPLLLAALKKQPDGPWAHYLLFKFAAATSEARALKGAERAAVFKVALGYLRPAADQLAEAAKAKPDDEMLRLTTPLLDQAVAEASLEAGGDLAPVKAAALALLEKNKDPKSWNYGNVIFEANTLLGRIALREGKIADAKKYLLESGKTPGSPQLNSFGPRMILAEELLAKGEKDAVLEFFELCRKFWRMEEGRLDAWSQAIKDGKAPDFHRP